MKIECRQDHTYVLSYIDLLALSSSHASSYMYGVHVHVRIT